MESTFETSFKYKLIYIFEIRDETHKGLLKIGNATIDTQESIDKIYPNSKALNSAAMSRIKQYTNTVGVDPKLLHTELAIKTVKNSNGSIVTKAFRDFDVHRVLENSGIKKKNLSGSTSREWFKTDLQTAIKAIDAVKKNYNNLSNASLQDFVPIVFRPEQEEAIEKTLKQFRNGNSMLWNAKMRFGKTLTALEVVRKSGFNKTIIITHRPVVDNGWYEDFKKIFHNEDYIYGSKSHGYSAEQLLKQDKKFVYFASMQDLRGSDTVGGKYDKNNIVFKADWDFVIVDEAHEGTKTALGEEVIKQIVKDNTKFLALSGTPFNIIREYEDNIYTWDYVMEQSHKKEWDMLHFGDSNPYEELPELKIYTYDLGEILKNKYEEIEDKAFNFREFFRVWTGDIKHDRKPMPPDKNVGDFYHEDDVNSFLNLISKTSNDSNYPYSKDEYRNLFKHSLWMVPGVKEAVALSKLMNKHPVFGCGQFKIVNVAGNGDKDEESKDALQKVRNAIDKAGDGYTITLSCGKLTTGVTVPEWTAVFMLAGSFSTSAANYLQTIFRVQSPCNKDGKIKSCCYVFDFAPDRTLKMVAESVALSTKAGKANESDKRIMGEFLNYCPVISIDGTQMKKYDTNCLLQQLKRAYAERAVQNGFDDTNLYNDELLKLDNVELDKFQKLKGIVGTSKAAPKVKDIDINNQGLTEEEYEELQKIERKPKSQRTPEEEQKLQEAKEKNKNKQSAISILRGISIRMPLLIYGADIAFDEDFTLEKFLDDKIVDPDSWEEFMPAGVTKDLFKEFIKYYDAEVFIAAGRKIRNTVKGADELNPTERVKKIADLFSYFKNPDKETVLTPWRVVNMHMSDCIGGFDFYEDTHTQMIEEPRLVDRGQVTKDVFENPDTKILEINSKTGLYPLYVTYSVYREKCLNYSEDQFTADKQNELWKETVEQNIFVICKTKMAKSITKRTLVGYKDIPVKAHYFQDLVNMMKNKPENFVDKVQKADYWKVKGNDKVKFDAIVGNPPYQIMDGGSKASATPIYNYFVENAKAIHPNYLSMIIPARWYSGGRGLDSFRENMLNDEKLERIFDYIDSNDCFSGVDIAGGICYFLWNSSYTGVCDVVNIHNGKKTRTSRNLKEYDVFIRYGQALSIFKKICSMETEFFDKYVSSQKPFGLRTYVKPTEDGELKLRYNGGTGPFRRELVTAGIDWIDKWKVIISYLTNDHAGRSDKEGKRKIFSTMEILPPQTVCTETYLVIDAFDNEQYAKNLYTYLCTKFVRFIVAQLTSTQHISKSNFSFVPYQDFSRSWTDKELYSKYHLTEDEVDFIENMIKPME